MKLNYPFKKGGGFVLPTLLCKTLGLVVLLHSSLYLSSQNLPSEFKAKVTFKKIKQVRYAVSDTSQFKCLTYQELSEYHDYAQITDEIELIDLEGELLTETVFLAEENVRDEWMDAYHKITVAKDAVYVYGSNKQKFVTKPKSAEIEFFTAEEISDYQNYVFDEQYYQGLIAFLIDQGIQHTIVNGIVTYQYDLFEVHTFDNNTKTNGVTYFDSAGRKIAEETMEFTLLNHHNYKPKSQCSVEWIVSKNGCCVKKYTQELFLNFKREVVGFASVTNALKDTKNNQGHGFQDLENQIEISAVNDRNMVLIAVPETETEIDYLVTIYDLNGKRLSEKSIFKSEMIEIPSGCSAGIYIIHVHDRENKIFKSGKTINPYTSN